VDRAAVFISNEIDSEIDRLGANDTGDFRELVTTHNYRPWTVTSRVLKNEKAH